MLLFVSSILDSFSQGPFKARKDSVSRVSTNNLSPMQQKNFPVDHFEPRKRSEATISA